MKKAALVLFTIAGAACAIPTLASSISYQKQVVLSVPVHVTYVNLNDRNVKVTVAIAEKGRGSSESVSSMISRTKPKAAITGTFFDTRSLLPTGDIIVGGIRAHSGCVGAALCITQENYARIVPHKKRAIRTASNYDTVLAGGPTLVDGGKVSMNPRAEGFRDPALFELKRRTAVGLTTENKLLFVSVNKPISMHKLAKIMVQLGCDQAIMLDGGSSTALYADGRFMSRPVRKLTNLLVAYETQEEYQLAAGKLAPTLISAKQMIASLPKTESDEAAQQQEGWSEQLADQIGFTDSVDDFDLTSFWMFNDPIYKKENFGINLPTSD
jgi:hypothetical protein